MIGKLIRCINCNEVMNITEWDSCPQYTYDNGKIKEIEVDDRKEFLQRHKGHKIEELIPITPPISEKPYTEPIKTCYFEATNGNERFLIKKWRDKIDSPFIYEIIKGRIEIKNIEVQVQAEAIKKQIQRAKDFCISEEKLNNFIKVIQKEVKKLDPQTLKVCAEGESPSISYCKLSDDCVKGILKKCQDKFNLQELNFLKNFISQNNFYNDVMTLIVKKNFFINAEEERIPCRCVAQRRA
ncbi:MAG TPA: hypothetical protein ENJ03_05275 [Candidatus Desulfofervidus auxilii]|uniref:Uncharacterized protein n=1 Tax=Desulfofervidus auxilii TaxID=1621989 RepID=A0A7V1I5K6_DESA2|nr:hypothetical protein [Candidatus Desulfofervidus auxilii]